MDSPQLESPLAPKEGSLGLKFSLDYRPGAYDGKHQWMGGTEVMSLVAHDGRLFAGISYWADDKPGADPKPGAQVLRKDAASEPWRVDVNFGKQYLRVEGLVAVTLSTDCAGQRLGAPVEALVASPYNFQDKEESRTEAWMRDDRSGQWVASTVEAKAGGARSFATHVDKATGVCHLFAGTWRGKILRGGLAPGSTHRLTWAPAPELSGTGRVMCFAECGGDLYAACGERDVTPASGGLYRRIDGPAPRWEQVYRWPYIKMPQGGDESNILRGLIAIPDPADGHEVLIGTRAWPGVVERIDPKKNHEVTAEVNIKGYFARVFGIAAYKGPALSAYNWLTPFTHPATGETVHLIGLWVNHPGKAQPPNNCSYYMIRRHDGSYEWGSIYDPAHPLAAGREMRGARAICVSPFPEDQGRALYFGGYDAWGGPHHNTAWIYKAITEARP